MSVDVTLRALADPTRREVIERLARGPCRAGVLAAACGASRPALSRHLRVLEQAALITHDVDPEDGRGRRFMLARGGLDDLERWMADVERFWSGQLQAFAAFVENDECEP